MDGPACACAKCSPTDLNNKTRLRSESRVLSLASARLHAEKIMIVCVCFLNLLSFSFVRSHHLFVYALNCCQFTTYLHIFYFFLLSTDYARVRRPKIYSRIFILRSSQIRFYPFSLISSSSSSFGGHLQPADSVRMKCIEDKFIEE